MGSPGEDKKAPSRERPAHPVAVPDFWIGKYEVTNREFVVFLNENAAKIAFDTKGDAMSLDGQKIGELFCGDKSDGCTGFVEMIEYDNAHLPGGEFSVLPGYENYPAVLVTWHGAKAYTAWLSKKTGLAYRLPTEAEWEYAARGGAQSQGYKYAGGNDASVVAWTYENRGDKRQFRVGQNEDNELLLYDMSGNVWEWCEDHWHDSYAGTPRDGSAYTSSKDNTGRLLRGGSLESGRGAARVANRDKDYPYNCDNDVGFRLARTP